MRKKLEFQADRIEAVLTIHKAPARVTGGTVTPRWVRFQVLPAEGTDTSRIKELRVQIASALEVPKSECQVLRRDATVTVEIVRNDPQPVRLGPLYRQLQSDGKFGGIPPMTAVLGLAEDGAPLLIRLPSPDVRHILISGIKNAGKTMLLRSIVLSLAMVNDPECLVFVILGDGLPEIEYSLVEQGHNLLRVENFGMALLNAFRVVGKQIIFVSDDVMGGNDKTAARLSHLMKNEYHHYILAWDGVPPPEIGDLFPVRIVGRVASAEDAQTATGWNGTGAERLMGRGDFLAVAKGQVHRFQAAFIGANEAAFRTEWAEQNGQLLKACQSGLTMPRLS